ETQIEQLTKELQSRTTNGDPSLSTRQCKVVNADHETPNIPISSSASVNVMPRNTFEYLRLANLRNTNMLVEKADMTKKAPLGLSWQPFMRKSMFLIKKISLRIDNSRGDRYAEWCNVSPTPGTSSQESNNPRPKDYTFREWTLIKVGHTDISEHVKKALLKLWLIDCFQDELRIIKDPHSQSFYDYKWVFDLEIDQLADEYELGIGKKGHMLDKIWEYCKDVHRDNTYWWHDHGFKKEECDEMEIEIENYDPPEVQVETFEVRKYSFKGGQKFVCVTKEVDDALPLERRNGSRFKEMIRKEFDMNTHDKM
ncbi:hypothetical protein Tco_1446026, partial [Tanacetum coccineum]